MFSTEQIAYILKKYAQDVVIYRNEEKLLHQGILMFTNENAQRYDFGLLEKQSGTYIYHTKSNELLDGDIMEFCGEKFLISKPQDVYFKNQVAYKKVSIEKF